MQQPLGPAQPIMDGIQQVGHGIMHPIESLRKMLGMDNVAAVPPQGPTMVDDANKSFQTPEHMSQPPEPVVAPPRRKPMGKM